MLVLFQLSEAKQCFIFYLLSLILPAIFPNVSDQKLKINQMFTLFSSTFLNFPCFSVNRAKMN